MLESATRQNTLRELEVDRSAIVSVKRRHWEAFLGFPRRHRVARLVWQVIAGTPIRSHLTGKRNVKERRPENALMQSKLTYLPTS